MFKGAFHLLPCPASFYTVGQHFVTVLTIILAPDLPCWIPLADEQTIDTGEFDQLVLTYHQLESLPLDGWTGLLIT